MKSEEYKLRTSIEGMVAAYSRGENVMAWARSNLAYDGANDIVSTLVAYDLQAGSYVANARTNPEFRDKWCAQLANLISPYIEPGDSILEVGVARLLRLQV
jgi:hypothetical protein